MRNAADSFMAGASEMWASVLVFFPKFILFVVVLVAGYFISKWIAQLVEVVLKGVGLERLLERGGVNRALAQSPYPALNILRKIVFFALFLLVLQVAFSSFGSNPVSDILSRIILFLPSLFVALLIVIVSAAVAKMARDIVTSALSRLSYGPVLGSATGAAVLIVGIFAALSHLEIAPAIVNGIFYAALAIVAGSAIVAIGGGGIASMQKQWEKAMWKFEAENRKINAVPPQAETEAEAEVEAQPRFGGRVESHEHSQPE